MNDWQRAAKRRLLIPLAIAVVGLVVYLVAGSDTVRVVGSGILGLAGLVLVSLMFLEVGYSEDREREREDRRG